MVELSDHIRLIAFHRIVEGFRVERFVRLYRNGDCIVTDTIFDEAYEGRGSHESLSTESGHTGPDRTPHLLRWHFAYEVEVEQSDKTNLVARSGDTIVDVKFDTDTFVGLRHYRNERCTNPGRPGIPPPWVVEVEFASTDRQLWISTFFHIRTYHSQLG